MIISSLLLLLTAFIWGSAFVAQSVGMEHVGPWTFVFFRYLVSAVVMIPVSLAAYKKLHNEKKKNESVRKYLKAGLCCGLFLGAASICQQAGMVHTSPGKAGFITALYVVFVPVFGLLFHRRPEKKIWFCVFLGLIGLYLISVNGGFYIEPADALVMMCALLFSGHILCVDYFSTRVNNLVVLSNIQFFVAAVVGAAGMIAFETPVWEDIRAAAIPVLYAGVLSGAAGYTLQMIAQRRADPTIASLLLSMESVFSLLAGWVILGQMLSVRELIGCALVLAAVILAQVPTGNRSRQRSQ